MLITHKKRAILKHSVSVLCYHKNSIAMDSNYVKTLRQFTQIIISQNFATFFFAFSKYGISPVG